MRPTTGGGQAMKIGIIGTGRHGSRYAKHIVSDCPELKLSALSRRTEYGGTQAENWGCRWFPDWRELVRDKDVEAVIAAVPPILNREIAHCCARHGKPLLLEKPLAVDVGAGVELVRSMRAAGVPLTIAQTLRYNPVIRRLREIVPEQGRLHTIYANQRIEPSTVSWLDEPAVAGAGITLHIAVHVFDALSFITGLRVRRLQAWCSRERAGQLEDLAQIRVEMENDVTGLIEVSKLSSGRSGRYEFVCSAAQVHGDQVHGQVYRLTGTKATTVADFPPTPTIPSLLQDWQRFLAGEGANPITGEDGLVAVVLAHACLRSSQTGRPVDIVAEFGL